MQNPRISAQYEEPSENDSYISKIKRVEEPVKMLTMYVKDIRGMSRKKREARETLESMRYHVETLLFAIGKFEEFLG